MLWIGIHLIPIGIQHFRCIRIQIQDFDEQKLEKDYRGTMFCYFLKKIVNVLLINFFLFLRVNFGPPGSGSNPDSGPRHCCTVIFIPGSFTVPNQLS